MTYYIVDTHGLVWFLEKNPKLGERAREVFFDEDSNLIIPTIVLAEIKFLFGQTLRRHTQPQQSCGGITIKTCYIRLSLTHQYHFLHMYDIHS
jgi:PIN domain nuclease of toxin-antitoxin system